MRGYFNGFLEGFYKEFFAGSFNGFLSGYGFLYDSFDVFPEGFLYGCLQKGSLQVHGLVFRGLDLRLGFSGFGGYCSCFSVFTGFIFEHWDHLNVEPEPSTVASISRLQRGRWSVQGVACTYCSLGLGFWLRALLNVFSVLWN